MSGEKIFKIIATIVVFGVFVAFVFAIHPVKVPIWSKALAFLALCGIWGKKWP